MSMAMAYADGGGKQVTGLDCEYDDMSLCVRAVRDIKDRELVHCGI